MNHYRVMLVLLTLAGQLMGNQTGLILIRRGPTVNLVSPQVPEIYFCLLSGLV